MIEFLEDLLVTQRLLISIILLSLITAVIIMKYWDRVKFWWTCTWYSFPVIGKISKLSKDITSRDGNWFSSETTLCSDFYRYYNFKGANPEHYDICKDYLKKIDETGRKPFPLIMWIVVFALVILEALGFAYVLAGFTIPGASESLQQYGAFGIALIISIILVGFTHWTGYEIYKNGILKKIRTYFQNDKIEERKSLTQNNNIDLSETTFADKDEKIYIQLLNRVKDANANATSSWMISIITAIFVVVIAIGATYVRGQVLEKQLIEEKSMTQTNVYEQSLPTSLVQTQESADTKAFDEAQDSDRKGGWATFIVLAVLFIFIQLLGILFGMKWGFAGKKSEVAFNYIDGFDNKQDYIEYYKRKKESISRIAEQKLKLLQQRMNQRGTQISSSAEGMNLLITKDNRTFKEYVKIQSEEKKEQTHTESNNSSEENNTNPAITTRENKIDTTKNEIELCRNPECKKPLKKGAKRCTCGLDVKTEKKCPKCNFVDDDIEAKFCPNCDEKVELV
ncbi:zinc ribbon domain-containing protein [Aliarcobacter cryaerophilus]|uniref:zinc ribbon domain-containing protein n=1 Tax=Aliarcobacter cryaerophilus TaxID=28198 RepID=UPI0021B30F5F|nr:zinc ribbon domain-containing protein [Aliarcobacter cryaerophilus]MCT7526490.1 zinc ribbon domain-containing protein [Aliarcobacter cryaerophilus]